jgi:LacI family transcriptional regulator
MIRKKANLRDVAKQAGVSVATVSRVLNSPKLVQDRTRERVQAVIDELGFVRNAAARAINSGRTRILGALIPTLESDIFALTISVIENRLVDLGFSLVVATTDDDPEKEARKAQELIDNGVEGFFLTGRAHSETLYKMLDKYRVPAVAISCFDPDYRIPTIGYDNHFAARLAYEHLVSCGHERIGIVHGPTNNDRTLARLTAIEELRGQRIHDVFAAELSVAGGAEAASAALKASERCDALLCLSDVMAFGVLHELHRKGMRVPEEMSVMGIHDLPASQDTYPRLTTVHLPVHQMGNQAAEKLAEWVVEDVRPEPVYIPSDVVVRESVAKLKA